MQFSTILAALAAVTVPSLAVQLTYDNTYDNGFNSMLIVACSNGENGLFTRGFPTFNSLPTYPFVGGAQAVTGWNSPNCGSCWRLTYAPTGNNITITALDFAGSGFNVAQAAMDRITNGRAVEFGNVDVTAEQVDVSECGL